LRIYLTYKNLPLPLSKPSAHGKHFMACLLFSKRPWSEAEKGGGKKSSGKDQATFVFIRIFYAKPTSPYLFVGFLCFC